MKKTNKLYAMLLGNIHENKSRTGFVKRIGILSMSLLGVIALLISFSIIQPETLLGVFAAVGLAGAKMAFIPFVANVKIKKGDHGYDHDETEDEYLQRKAAHELAIEMKGLTTAALETFKKEDPEYKALLEMKGKFDDLKLTDKEVKEIKDKLEILGLSVKGLKGKKESNVLPIGMKGVINEWIKTNSAKILELKKAGSGTIELQIKINENNEIVELKEENARLIETKVAGAMTVSSASLPVAAPDIVGVQMAPPSRVNYRNAIIDSLITSIATGMAAFAYTESVPKDGDYSFLAEQGTKPLIDMLIKTRYATPCKVAAHMELTEESVTDIPGLQSIAFDLLKSKHDLKRQYGILFGDGNSPNPKGATVYAIPFAAGAMAGTVRFPNIKDVIGAMATQIFTTHNFTDETPYIPNVALMHPMDFFVYVVSAKDELGRDLFPNAGLFNQVNIGGTLVIPFENAGLPAGTIFVADMSKYMVTNYVGYSVRIGWINDQFITNQFSIVGESRFHAFVKKLDEVAFVIDEIETVMAAIKTV